MKVLNSLHFYLSLLSQLDYKTLCLAGFGKLSKLRHLENLDLSYNRLNDSTLSSLSKISTLKSLNLSGNVLFTGPHQTNGNIMSICIANVIKLDIFIYFVYFTTCSAP